MFTSFSRVRPGHLRLQHRNKPIILRQLRLQVVAQTLLDHAHAHAPCPAAPALARAHEAGDAHVKVAHL